MYVLRSDINKPQRELLPVLPGQSNDSSDAGPVWPRIPKVGERKDVHRDPGLCQEEGEMHPSEEKKAFVSKKNGCSGGGNVRLNEANQW